MSSIANATSTSSNFAALFDAALDKYTKRTGQNLRNHPMAAIIDRCDSLDSVLDVFKDQSLAFDRFRNGGPKLLRWLTPVANGLYVISTNAAISAGASLAFSPANIIFSGIGILLSTAKYVRESYDALVDIFECIENFLSRLRIYTQIKPTPALTEMVIKILVELLGVLALATNQINQGRLKKYARKLLGEKDIESVLQRLDRLSLEESKMTATQTLDVVYGLVKNMEVVMEDGRASTDDIRQTLVLMQELVMKVNKMERDRLQEDVRHWFSAPDPWTNHNIARKAHHYGTSTWFTEGEVFRKWKSTGGLLWINGLPGSGKTVLLSSIIECLHDMRQMGLATISFFYFDFRDSGKQDIRHLLISILIQLCVQSDQYSEILSTLFKDHNGGTRQPTEDALLECLKNMLKLPGQGTLYIIIDALDESPNSSGLTSPRAEVLMIVQKLVELSLPHVHFCITSRPEIDIRDVLEPLATHSVPLQNQVGQRQDIIDYITSVVHSHKEMRRWRDEDKMLVIDTLIERAGGMFRWIYCQLETLSRCFPPSIRRALDELPATLDETYERALMGIDREKMDYANRLFQCLVVSIRPLRADELAELFAILPKADSTSEFNIGWRPEDPEEFILSTCTTLVSIVNIDGERVIQFSHFSVKEYLTSHRIANAEHVSRFHIHPKSAHTLIAKACLSVLFQLDNSIDQFKIENFPLALYAAEHWVEHARFEGVSSEIRDGMDLLFEKDKPYFATWVWVYDIDYDVTQIYYSARPEQHDIVPLYYAARCGFRDLVERLLVVHPQDLNAGGGFFGTPLNAALAEGHLDIALFLLDCGADVNHRSTDDQTGLYIASSRGYADVVRSLIALIDRGADLNAICTDYDETGDEVLWTPLHLAVHDERPDIVNLLLERGTDTEILTGQGQTALYMASSRGFAEVVRLLIDHGADVNVGCDDYEDGKEVRWTPLHAAAYKDHQDIALLLLEHGANTEVRSSQDQTALYVASSRGLAEVVRLLINRGANVDAKCDGWEEFGYVRWTPLDVASYHGRQEIARVLLEHGADVHYQDNWGWSPLHYVSRHGFNEIARLLLDHGANPNASNNEGVTALHVASFVGENRIVKLLLDNGAYADPRSKNGWTPLNFAVEWRQTGVLSLLLDYGADVNAQRNSR